MSSLLRRGGVAWLSIGSATSLGRYVCVCVRVGTSNDGVPENVISCGRTLTCVMLEG